MNDIISNLLNDQKSSGECSTSPIIFRPPALVSLPPTHCTLDGFQISENGTLCIDLYDGQYVAVRSRGLETLVPAKEPEEQGPDILGRAQWSDFKIGPIIGEGSQAVVRKVKNKKTGKKYALKCITVNTQVSKRALQQELSFVIIPSHPNVVETIDAFYVNRSLRVLMEYMDMGSLSNLIEIFGPLPHDIFPSIVEQMLSGLASLHAADMIHRDIKPSNLLLNSNGLVKIADFGVSTFISSTRPYACTELGSAAYMSPERVRGEEYDSKSDIWAVGLTVAECCLGRYPIFIENSVENNENPFEQKLNTFDLSTLLAESRIHVDFDVFLKELREFYPNMISFDISLMLKEFVWLCMKQCPKHRPSCIDLLKHPLLKQDKMEVQKNTSRNICLQEWLRDNNIKTKFVEKRNNTKFAKIQPLG